ncbi:unnamed protein product [Closterium sp. NIES-65]|nr:unnamed protein product [Closterium sp. NIES-65]
MTGSSNSTEWMWGGDGDFCDEEFADHSDRSGRTGYYSGDEEQAPWRGQAETVMTTHGPLRVTVCGNRSLPPLLTYHDIGLNHSTCFEGLMLCPDTAHLLLGNFCIYHIDAPGHEAGAGEISPLEAQLTASDLAEQVAEVMAWFRLPPAVCIGVGAGAYVLTLLALERPQAVQSLVLVSPVCRAASWGEWARSKVLLGVLCVAGMSKYVKDALVHRYFCHQQTGFHGPASDSILMFRQELDNREPENVMRYLDIIHSRIDLTPFLLHLKCPVLLVAGEMSEASMQEAAHMMCHLDPMTTSWVQVEASGALVTEERPHMLRKPLESFFARQGMHCVSPFAASLDYSRFPP